MATKATKANIDKAYLGRGVVAASNEIRQGTPVVWSSGKLVEATAIGAEAFAVAYISEDGVWPAGAGDEVTFVYLGSPCSVPVLVGTGGATQGKFLRPVATTGGCTDATVGGGTTAITVIGQCNETGVAGDLVGCNLGPASATVGS